MTPEQSSFEAGWFSIELPGVRTCAGTYCLFPYEQLPPIDESQFLDEFQWLPGLDDNTQAQMALHRRATDRIAPKLDKLVEEADALDVYLPVSFLVFMGNQAMRDAIPSCTACYFHLSESIIPSPFGDNGHFVRFLNDQQDVLVWYVYIAPDGDHCIVTLPVSLEDDLEDIDFDQLKAHTFYASPNFESFIYRFWLENSIWFADEEGRDLTDAEKRYIEHYESSK
jgi:hypothetical protein